MAKIENYRSLLGSFELDAKVIVDALIRKIILTLLYPLLWRIVGTWLPRFPKRDLVISTEKPTNVRIS